MEYWFRLNFVPFEADRPWYTLGVSVLNGPDLLMPEHEPPLIFLEQEFFGVLSSEVIADLATRLLQESAEWSPVPPDTSTAPVGDPAAAALAALELVEADLSRAGAGHNQGPPLDPEIVAQTVSLVRDGREAIAAGPDGVKRAGAVQVALLAIASTVVLPFFKRLSEHAADDAYPHLAHHLVIVSDHMLQAAEAVGRWIASMPPGPLL